MRYEFIKYDVPRPHVARVTLHRPEQANALSRGLLHELADAVERIAADDEIRVWLLAGSPRTDGRPWFSAGVDMKEVRAGAVQGPSPGAALCDRIEELLKPSIAVIDGTCTTGALELALSCDLRVASTTAEISDWHLSRTGLGIGAWGAAARLSRLVGVARAKELLLLSETVVGSEAAGTGLVNRAVSSDRLDQTALDMASRIAGMPRRGVRMTMGYLQVQAEMSQAEALRWAERLPGFMGVELRGFEDAADRFFDGKESRPPA